MAPVTDINEATSAELKRQFGIWIYIAIGASILFDAWILFSVWTSATSYDEPLIAFLHDLSPETVLLFMGPWIALIIVRRLTELRVREKFWIDFASENGFTYQKIADHRAEKGIMFKQGSSRAMYNVVQGVHGDLPVTFFQYQFTIGSGKNKETYEYTAFEFKTGGTFPNLFLNYKKDKHRVIGGKRLALPNGLSELYELSVPEQYEIEALQIFTPDVLELLLELGLTADIELCDGEVLIFMEGFVSNRGELNMRFARAVAFASRLRPVLSRMNLSNIGSYTPNLK